MRVCLYYIFFWALFAAPLSGQEHEQKNIVQQIGHYEELYSKILDEKRTLLIHLPDDYETSVKKYPVLFILDAENTHLFSQAVSAANFYSGVRRLPKMIIIGIINTNRTRDITPAAIKQRKNSGSADNFLKFMAAELIPYINTTYRAASCRILSGGSSAGMFTLYTLFDRPELFNANIAARPALNSTEDLTWDSELIFRRAESFLAYEPELKRALYIDYGSQEDALHDPAPIHKLAGIFEQHPSQGFRWKTQKTGESGYRSAESLKNGLLWMFKDWYYPADSLYVNGIEGLKKHAEHLTSQFNYSVDAGSLLSEQDFIRFGWRFFEHNMLDEAVLFFNECLKSFPESWTAYECLGDVFQKKDMIKSAQKNYEKCLQLNPDNKYAQEMLKKLKAGN